MRPDQYKYSKTDEIFRMYYNKPWWLKKDIINYALYAGFYPENAGLSSLPIEAYATLRARYESQKWMEHPPHVDNVDWTRALARFIVLERNGVTGYEAAADVKDSCFSSSINPTFKDILKKYFEDRFFDQILEGSNRIRNTYQQEGSILPDPSVDHPMNSIYPTISDTALYGRSPSTDNGSLSAMNTCQRPEASIYSDRRPSSQELPHGAVKKQGHPSGHPTFMAYSPGQLPETPFSVDGASPGLPLSSTPVYTISSAGMSPPVAHGSFGRSPAPPYGAPSMIQRIGGDCQVRHVSNTDTSVSSQRPAILQYSNSRPQELISIPQFPWSGTPPPQCMVSPERGFVTPNAQAERAKKKPRRDSVQLARGRLSSSNSKQRSSSTMGAVERKSLGSVNEASTADFAGVYHISGPSAQFDPRRQVTEEHHRKR